MRVDMWREEGAFHAWHDGTDTDVCHSAWLQEVAMPGSRSTFAPIGTVKPIRVIGSKARDDPPL